MRKLLIVDDEGGIVEEVRDFFTEEGYDVRTADSGKDGLRVLDEHKPDIMLLDIKLPDISGLEVLKYSKQTYPKTKIIVVTGYVDQAIIDEAESLGRDAFMQKPFDLLHLVDEIDRLLGES